MATAALINLKKKPLYYFSSNCESKSAYIFNDLSHLPHNDLGLILF